MFVVQKYTLGFPLSLINTPFLARGLTDIFSSRTEKDPLKCVRQASKKKISLPSDRQEWAYETSLTLILAGLITKIRVSKILWFPLGTVLSTVISPLCLSRVALSDRPQFFNSQSRWNTPAQPTSKLLKLSTPAKQTARQTDREKSVLSK